MSGASARARRLVTAAFLPALLAGGLAAGTARTAPMTDEDVVRMFVAGSSREELIAEIERRDPGFDVSSEMLDELRMAGLPAPVIDAMVRRQREADAANAPDVVPAEIERPPVLRIVIDPDRTPGNRPVLSLRETVDPALAAEWRLDDDPESRVFADIAVYVACRTPEHVPDHWRSHSPLGRDFFSMPRHKLIEFAAGARRAGDGMKARLELEVPQAFEIVLEPAVPHDVLLGIAVEVGGRYRRVVDDEWAGLVLEDGDRELAATVEQGRGGRAFPWVVRFEGEGEGEETPD